MHTKKFRCPVCDCDDKWENVDEFRHKAHGQSLCRNCGFVTYPERVSKTQELKSYYEADYRRPPSAANIYTCERKNHYHAAFIGDLLQKWKEHKPDASILEIGAAFGMVLHWIKGVLPESNVYGTELTESFVRNAWHLNGVKLTDDYDKTKKYDLMITYKVHEHIPNPDQHLREMRDCLSDDGYLYISVPTWFGKMTNFGLGGFDLEYYYHPDHINVWSRKLFESVLKKVGFEVVRANFSYYDETYLCKKAEPIQLTQDDFENPDEIRVLMSKIKKAESYAMAGKTKEAIETFGNYPSAWQQHYELNRKVIHDSGPEFIYEGFIKPALEKCQGSADITLLCADIYMRYSNYPEAIKYIDAALNLRPNFSTAIRMKSQCFRMMSQDEPDKEAKLKYRIQARDWMRYLARISTESFAEAISWEMADNAEIPIDYNLGESEAGV